MTVLMSLATDTPKRAHSLTQPLNQRRCEQCHRWGHYDNNPGPNLCPICLNATRQ
jgi:cytochrome c2